MVLRSSLSCGKKPLDPEDCCVVFVGRLVQYCVLCLVKEGPDPKECCVVLLADLYNIVSVNCLVKESPGPEGC